MSLANHIRVFLCVVFMGMLVGYVFNAKKDITDHEYIDIVKEGYLENFSDVTVRNAFNYAFFEPYWRYYQAKTGEQVIELSGEITFQGEKGHAILQFVVDEQTKQFSLRAMKFNENVLNAEQKQKLVGMVYQTWEMKQLAYE
ncbi:hypothetical protein ACE1MS_13545 [Lysinibacillus sp. fkY74-1]|uniref:Uncharacterized protein n=3 Tax=Lysinibacillus TaxID=400634 RepID=W7RMN2_LYSSH|nr:MULTISPECIES: hypothetical protein [Lysinibacillus]AMO33181.1 hypothetical protein AR327_12375 [Lysinibacillus sphaericus]AMR91716.1 hypothetical protein A1T07_16840 [Lysinibacillus sphaericus]ANA45763.1 hypothetical protein A2J09_09500 [Lysinibacillus sphaericus]EWH32817.1 hypothetical protein P799_12130 [Lysinibacillus sphaericus CBAM5]KZL45226.1 hypothetical protein A2J08_10130 [Lysinibacillus sphaericus]